MKKIKKKFSFREQADNTFKYTGGGKSAETIRSEAIGGMTKVHRRPKFNS
jgi:hypothetical protein